jgi:hypothetical protein
MEKILRAKLDQTARLWSQASRRADLADQVRSVLHGCAADVSDLLREVPSVPEVSRLIHLEVYGRRTAEFELAARELAGPVFPGMGLRVVSVSVRSPATLSQRSRADEARGESGDEVWMAQVAIEATEPVPPPGAPEFAGRKRTDYSVTAVVSAPEFSGGSSV